MSFSMLEWIILGLSPFVGSFLGVLILRLPEGQGVIAGRSNCTDCKHVLGVLDLVPILSWVVLKGKCRHCQRRISGFYPTIEIAATVMAFWALVVTSGPVQIITVLLGWVLLALAMIDFRKFILLDVLTLPLIPLGFATVYYLNPGEVVNSLIGAAAGFVALFMIGALYKALRQREGLGFGDVKLFAAAGAWAGWAGLSGVLMWAVVFAFLFLGVRKTLGHALKSTTKIPFGAFLSLGIWLVWLYGPLLLF